MPLLHRDTSLLNCDPASFRILLQGGRDFLHRSKNILCSREFTDATTAQEQETTASIRLDGRFWLVSSTRGVSCDTSVSQLKSLPLAVSLFSLSPVRLPVRSASCHSTYLTPICSFISYSRDYRCYAKLHLAVVLEKVSHFRCAVMQT